MAAETFSVLGPDYEDMRPMSVGGLGELFRAHKRGLDVDVVVKRVKSQYKGSSSQSQTREADILKNLRHQFLPQIYDIIYAPDGYIYTVMDFIRGENLQEYVEKHGAVDQRLGIKWLRELASVVQYLHSQHPPVIHCDIKPGNIMICPDGDIRLIDFNTSLIFDNPDMLALGVTNGYAAPEQYRISDAALDRMPPDRRQMWSAWNEGAKRAGKISERTDIYAIGAVGYFMLTGYTPAHSQGDVVPLSRYDIRISDAFREVLERAMRPAAKDRFASAKAMVKALSDEELTRADRRYRAWKRSCQVTAVLLGTLFMVSVFSVWEGFNLRSGDKGREYTELITRADGQIEALDYDGALDTLVGAIALDGNRIEAYIRAGTILYRTGRYSECETLLSEASFVYNEDTMTEAEFGFAQAEIDYMLGSCYFNEGRYEDAVVYLSLAVEFDGDEALYYRDLAVTKAVLGRVDDARRDLESLRECGGGQEDTALVEGEISYAAGDYAAALEPFLTLTGSSDSGIASRAYLRAAMCCRYTGDMDREIEILEDARRVLDPAASLAHCEQLTDAYLRRGNAGSDEGDYQAACDVAQGIIDRGMATLAVRLNHALALQYLGRLDEAEDDLEGITQDFPNSYRGFMRLALLKLDSRVADYDGAREAYDQASTLYSGAGVQDSEMTYLAQLMADLAAG